LKPLELADTGSISVFLTSDGNEIPKAIASRYATLRFGLVSQEAIARKLLAIAERERIRYTNEGVQAIARRANGRPGYALRNLALVAATGEVTVDSVEAALHDDTEAMAKLIFMSLVQEDINAAVTQADQLAQRIGPVKLIQALFSFYAHDISTGSSISSSFAQMREMSRFFIRWSSATQLPADTVPLFVLELNDMRAGVCRPLETPGDGPRYG
jgi:DNA polymerase III gamma/tau subunit